MRITIQQDGDIYLAGKIDNNEHDFLVVPVVLNIYTSGQEYDQDVIPYIRNITYDTWDFSLQKWELCNEKREPVHILNDNIAYVMLHLSRHMISFRYSVLLSYFKLNERELFHEFTIQELSIEPPPLTDDDYRGSYE